MRCAVCVLCVVLCAVTVTVLGLSCAGVPDLVLARLSLGRLAVLRATGGVEFVSAEVDTANRFGLRSVLQSLHRQHGVGSVMVEGGVRLIQNMILEHTQGQDSGNRTAVDGELVDTVVVTVSTQAIGGKRLEGVTYNLGSNPPPVTFRLGACSYLAPDPIVPPTRTTQPYHSTVPPTRTTHPYHPRHLQARCVCRPSPSSLLLPSPLWHEGTLLGVHRGGKARPPCSYLAPDPIVPPTRTTHPYHPLVPPARPPR